MQTIFETSAMLSSPTWWNLHLDTPLMKRRSDLDMLCDDVSTPSLSEVSSISALQYANSSGAHGDVVPEFKQATGIIVVGPPQIGRGSRPCLLTLPMLRPGTSMLAGRM
jgi:hypothetical protein